MENASVATGQLGEMIRETTEMRWFWATENLPALLRWFSPDPLAFSKAAQTRTDEYLLLPGCRTTGVKRREGHLEVKGLVADEGAFAIHDGLNGRVQRWIKWTRKNPAESENFVNDSSDWQSVTKTRLLRQFLWNGQFVEWTSAHAEPHANCHIELTKVSLLQSPTTWVTLGIEVFGNEIDQVTVLRKMVQHLFHHPQQTPNELLHADSLSYPEWLTTWE